MISIFFFLFLILFQQCWSQESEWAIALGKKFESLQSNVMKVDTIRDKIIAAKYDSSDIDGSDYVARLAKELKDVLVRKEGIVNALADKVASLWRDAKDSEETQCSYRNALSNGLSTEYNEVFNASISFDYSTVKIAPGVSESTIEKEICFTARLDMTFKDNAEGNPNLPWQYFGSQAGYHRQYPGLRRPNNYDPRERPWYTGATTGPKDVVLILDVSGSMGSAGRMALMKSAANAVLGSLTNDDFVNVVAFSSDATTPRCARSSLLRATGENIAYLQNYVNLLQENGRTDYYAAFSTAFDLFDAKTNDGTQTASSDCRKAILFLTDGEPTNENDHEEMIRERNAKHNAHIFTYALGDGATTQDDIACDNQGMYTDISDGGNLRGKMAGYYQLFALSAVRRIFWTSPYLDASGLGMMITASKPVYDDSDEEAPRLLGVVGHDILLPDFTQLVGSFGRGKSYAFLVDKNGLAVWHPRLASSVRVDAPPIYQDIALLENNYSPEFLQKVRNAMLTQESGSHRLTIERQLEAGDSTYEGLRVEKLDVVYIWQEAGPFVLCYVLADEDVSPSILPPVSGPASPPEFWHELEMYKQLPQLDTDPVQPVQLPRTHARYPGAYLTFNATTVYLAPRAFVDPLPKATTASTPTDVALYHQYINGITENFAGTRDEVLRETRRLQLLNEQWVGVEQVEPAMGWLYFGTESGIHRRYPGGNQLKLGYTPSDRPWFKRALTTVDRLAVSTPYFDASGLGRVVTLSQTVPRTDESSAIAGVIGLDFIYSAFDELVRSSVPCNSTASLTRVCFLIDSSGYLITHPSFRNAPSTIETENIFMGRDDASLSATLLSAKWLEARQHADYKTQQNCTTFAIDASNLGDGLPNACGSGIVKVAPVPIGSVVTNAYLVVLENWRGGAAGICARGDQTAQPRCEPLVAPDPCDANAPKPFERVKAQCPAFAPTEDMLERLRDEDPDGGQCSNPTLAIVLGVLAAIIYCICIIAGVVIYKRRN